ncbi:MAG TPA: hypothetical protein VFY26_07935 [Anaerolineales bacterium]|nr:hypothetical protein [Anaerolineales bacterium]
MNKEELIELVIRELGKHHERRDIVARICEQSTLGWGEAEQLVTEVESQYKRKVAARQGPFLVLVSIGTLVIGLGLLIYNIELIAAIFNKDLLGQILSLRSGYLQLISLFTGLGMTVGGLYGMWNALAALMPDSK